MKDGLCGSLQNIAVVMVGLVGWLVDWIQSCREGVDEALEIEVSAAPQAWRIM